MQRCGRCGRAFSLVAGPAFDVSVQPPPYDPTARRVSFKWSLIAVVLFAALEPRGVTTGMLDPVVGLAPINQTEVSYWDVVSIAVWRKPALLEAIAAILVPVPIALFAAYGVLVSLRGDPAFAAVCGAGFVVFGLLAAILLRRALIVGRRQARIIGRLGTVTVPFDGKRAFYNELFRRCGLPAAPIP